MLGDYTFKLKQPYVTERKLINSIPNDVTRYVIPALF